MLSTMMVLD